MYLEEVVEVLAIDWEVHEKPTFDMAFRLPDPLDLLTICSSLVTLEEDTMDDQDASTPQKRTLVRLAHSSVRDYLISDRIGTSPAAEYALNEALSHSFITQCCLTYLLQFTGPMDPRSALTFPLVQYATQFWTNHFQASGATDTEELENMAFTLLTSDQMPFSNWCQFYNPDKPWLDRWNDRQKADGSPLYYMSLLGLTQLCKRLLAAHADPNASGGLYRTPLLAAANNGHGNVVELLLNAKASPNRTKRGESLRAAASRGYDKIIESLLSHGAGVDINAISLGQSTALASAARNGHEKVVQILLHAGADSGRYDRKTGIGPPIVEAALHGHDTVVRQLLPSSPPFGIYEATIAAASNGHENVVRLLVEAKIERELALTCAARVGAHDLVSRLIHEGAGINVEPRRGVTPLESAITGGHLLIIQQLIAEGASYEPGMVSLAVANGHTCVVQHLIQQYPHGSVILSKSLVIAVKKGLKSIVELLLDNGADIETQDSRPGWPLRAAVASGNLDLLKLLLERGANINSDGGQGNSLRCAAYDGNLQVIQYLIEYGANPKLDGALQDAAMNGHIPVIEELLAVGANINSRGQMGSALDCAITGGHPDTVRLLLERGASASEVIETEEGKTSPWPNPLLHASRNRNGDFHIVKLLLDAGADPNASSILWGNFRLPLHAAAKMGNIDILQVLLEHGAKVNAQAEDGFGAIHFAAQSGYHDALQFLLFDHHANPELVLFNGTLALHLAASHGYPKCIEVCLEVGLDVNSRNDQGSTALHWATKNGHRAAVEILLERGVDVNVRETATGMTALDYAMQKAYEQPEKKSWKDLVELLKAKTFAFCMA